MRKTRLIKHIRRWNKWQKHNLNSPLHRILVLFGIIKSPTLQLVNLPEENETVDELLCKLHWRALREEEDKDDHA